MRHATKSLRKIQLEHIEKAYPHEPGCPQCHRHRLCNVCGTKLIGPVGAIIGCSNGRCLDCHAAVCCEHSNHGGEPGHGVGTLKDATRRAREVAQGKTKQQPYPLVFQTHPTLNAAHMQLATDHVRLVDADGETVFSIIVRSATCIEVRARGPRGNLSVRPRSGNVIDVEAIE
jgi:hypothetical protein